jgi:hypothetical protein
MKINRHRHGIAVAVYALPLVYHITDSLVKDARDGVLILASVALVPAVLYFCGIRWCRYVVGAFAVFFILLCLVIPMMQHSVDRTGPFWFLWCLVLSMFIFPSVMTFARP